MSMAPGSALTNGAIAASMNMPSTISPPARAMRLRYSFCQRMTRKNADILNSFRWGRPSSAAADPAILEPLVLERFGVILVASVEDHRRFHHAFHGLEIGMSVRLPFGHQGQGIDFFDGLVLGARQGQCAPLEPAGRVFPARRFQCFRIVGDDG